MLYVSLLFRLHLLAFLLSTTSTYKTSPKSERKMSSPWMLGGRDKKNPLLISKQTTPHHLICTQNYHILPEGNKTNALLLPRSPALLEAQGHLIPEVVRRCEWERTYQYRRSKKRRFHPWVGKIPWRRAWQPTPAFLPGEFHGQRSLVGYSPWGSQRAEHN